jgi:hypothetical protein
VSAPRTALPLLPWRERTAWQRLDAWANGDTAGAPYIGTGEMLRDLRALLLATRATPETIPTASEGDE